MTNERMARAREIAVTHLLAQRTPEGYWEGCLSSSALSTATALSAFSLAEWPEDHPLIDVGARWLAETQHTDGGWGDTVDSPSNLATTVLVIAALTLAGNPQPAALTRASDYLVAHDAATPAALTAAITRAYGDDRTFAVPILMNAALAGLVAWADIPGLPFEIAALPPEWYPRLRLHVVSYALPALIAVGLLLHQKNPPANPLLRRIRKWATRRALARLAAIQPEHGGFLDATPLTAFVTMSLVPCIGRYNPVVGKCLKFLRNSMRADGSWPIDSNLSVWVTTGAMTALLAAGQEINPMTVSWVCDRQHTALHPFTNAAPGGWGWTHLPGGVPDADDTAGAMLALARLHEREPLTASAAWLLGLQNMDGGFPTFCRGWGHLPFDRSSPDITAHALRALHAADYAIDSPAIARGLRYLHGVQRPDGGWEPLWFGNQYAPVQANPVLGTARVVLAYADLTHMCEEARRGIAFLLAAQHPDGGWGGAAGVPATIEETALAVIALARYHDLPGVADAYQHGLDYLARRVEDGTWIQTAPIGLYFASLWYAETLYPVIWTVEALGSATGEGV